MTPPNTSHSRPLRHLVAATVFLTATVCAGLIAPVALAATATTAPSARGVIDQFTRDIIATLRDSHLSRPDKSKKVRDMAYQHINFETLSRLTLGRYWRDLTDAQRADFTQEFRKHLTATYGHTTDEYTDEDIKITADRQESNNDWTVLTQIIGTKDGTRKEIAKVDYRLRQSAGAWQIIDVTIDGVSLMANFRSQFQDIMSNGGIDRLLKLLREKNAESAK